MRNEACSQFETAQRWRITPAAAWVAPSASRIRAHSTSARLSSATIPFWIARPIAAGISACETIQTTPKKTPASSVPTWWRATHSRKRTGDRVSGRPGSVKGSLIMWVVPWLEAGRRAPLFDRTHGFWRRQSGAGL